MKQEMDIFKFPSKNVMIDVCYPLMQIYPASNKTLLLRKTAHNRKLEVIYHVTLQNQLLWQFFFDSQSLVEVVNETHVVVANRKNPTYDIYCLENQEIIEIKRSFVPQQDIAIMFFQQSQLFCIVQITDSQKYSFLYFSSTNITKNAKTVHHGQASNSDTRECQRLDSQSKIGWSAHEGGKVSLMLYSLENDCNGQIQGKYQQMQYFNSKLDLELYFIREIKKDQYLTWDHTSQYFIVNREEKTNTLEVKEFILEKKFSQEQETTFLDSLGSVFIFIRHLSFLRRKQIILVDMQTREVIQTSCVQQEEDITKVGKGLMERRTIIEFSDLEQGRKVVVKLTDLLLDAKDVFLHFLLHLNEDFDDDLLYDSIDLLSI